MLPHSTVVSSHFVAAVADACTSPVVIGIVVVRDSVLAPSGPCCSPAVAVVVAVAAFVVAIVAAVVAVATVAAVVDWVTSGVVVDVVAMCIDCFVGVPSRPLVCPKQIYHSPCS